MSFLDRHARTEAGSDSRVKRRNARRYFDQTFGLLVLILGLLIGYQGYGRQFYSHDPQLDAKYDKALSLCGESHPVLNFLPLKRVLE